MRAVVGYIAMMGMMMGMFMPMLCRALKIRPSYAF